MKKSRNGVIVITASPEMSQLSGRALRSGVTYVVQEATVVGLPETSGSVKKTSSSKPKAISKKSASNKPSAKAPVKTKATSAKMKTVKAAVRKNVQPDVIIAFVRGNAGCNMTDIESSVKAPQAQIRRVLKDARDAGQIRTEGQRRGLRYFAEAVVSDVSSATQTEAAAVSRNGEPW